MSFSFAVTWDYRCPFARNVHEHILTGLAAGADWDVEFVPFSLSQSHVEHGQPSVWEDPTQDSGILALQTGVLVRDQYPEAFPAVHRALFAARHDAAQHLNNRSVVAEVLTANGIDAGDVFAEIDSGSVLEQVKKEHESAVSNSDVWGVPTFVVGDRAAFVRLMNRSLEDGDSATAVRAIERIVDMLRDWPELNEFKHTTLNR